MKFPENEKDNSSARGILHLLQDRWPGALGVPLSQVAAALSISRQTAYNQHSAGVFPIRVVKLGRKPIVLLQDLADFLDAQRGVPELAASDAEMKRGPGRPRKYPDAHRPSATRQA